MRKLTLDIVSSKLCGLLFQQTKYLFKFKSKCRDKPTCTCVFCPFMVIPTIQSQFRAGPGCELSEQPHGQKYVSKKLVRGTTDDHCFTFFPPRSLHVHFYVHFIFYTTGVKMKVEINTEMYTAHTGLPWCEPYMVGFFSVFCQTAHLPTNGPIPKTDQSCFTNMLDISTKLTPLY